jgi:hypothetical protein
MADFEVTCPHCKQSFDCSEASPFTRPSAPCIHRCRVYSVTPFIGGDGEQVQNAAPTP